MRHDGEVIVDDLLDRLSPLPPSAPRDAYLSFVRSRGLAALQRSGGPEHVTGSCFVFSPDFSQILLCFHKKGQFWVQFGGHLEDDDASVALGAQREAREESGIATLTLLTHDIADLDRHELHGGFSCAAHWDVGYVAVVDPSVSIAVSDESEDVRWFAVDALPENVASGLPQRIANLRPDQLNS